MRRLARLQLGLPAALLLTLLLTQSGNCQMVQNVTLGPNSLVQAFNGTHWGSILVLPNSSNVVETACAALKLTAAHLTFNLSSPNSGTELAPIFKITNCAHFSWKESNMWDFNQACDVMPLLSPSNGGNLLRVECGRISLDGAVSEGLVRLNFSEIVGTICVQRPTLNEAAAACRTLAFDRPENAIPLTSYLPPDNNTVAIELLGCEKDQLLEECRWSRVPSRGCESRFKQLSVRCAEAAPRPLPQILDLTCSKQYAVVEFDSAAVDQSELRLEGATNATMCKATFGLQGSRLALDLRPYDACATSVNQTNGINAFKFRLLFVGRKNHAGHWVLNPTNFTFNCKVRTDILVTANTLKPEPMTVTPKWGGDNATSVLLRLFTNMSKGDFYQQVDGPVLLGTKLYGVMTVESPQPNDFLSVKNCWALNEGDSSSQTAQRQNLVVNGAAEPGVTLFYVNNTAAAFQFTAFQFVNSSSTDTVYFFCLTVVCRLDDQSNDCRRSSLALRSSETERQRNSRAGPFAFVDAKDGNGGGRLGAGCNPWLVACALAALLVWWR